MDFLHLIQEAWGNLLVAKLRSLLTLLGILIGTASVVALVSSGELATQHALAQFKTLGTDLLAISINPSSDSDTTTAKLGLSQLPQLAHASPQIASMAPYSNYYGTISYQGIPLQGTVIGATETLQQILKIKLAAGRFVSFLDKDAYYCVIGNALAKKITPIGMRHLLGKQILVGNIVYTIVGITEPWPENIFMFADIDNAVIIPLANSFLLSKYVQIQNVIFQLHSNANIDAVIAQITTVVNRLVPNSQLFPRSAKQLIASMQKQRATLTLLLAFIGGISLIVGGIGVMNIMLVSVAERRREIGIRLAVGARGKDIGFMFISEALVLTIFGGILGIITGILVSFVAAEVSGWGFQLFLLPPVVGFLVSALVGIISGTYPAIQASRLDPIATLRSE